jgi:hypothetical protein
MVCALERSRGSAWHRKCCCAPITLPGLAIRSHPIVARAIRPNRRKCAGTPESSEAVHGNHALRGVSGSEEVAQHTLRRRGAVRKPHVEVLHRSGLKYRTIVRFGLVEPNYAADARLHEAGDVLLGSPCMCWAIRSGHGPLNATSFGQMALTPSSSSAMYSSTPNV